MKFSAPLLVTLTVLPLVSAVCRDMPSHEACLRRANPSIECQQDPSCACNAHTQMLHCYDACDSAVKNDVDGKLDSNEIQFKRRRSDQADLVWRVCNAKVAKPTPPPTTQIQTTPSNNNEGDSGDEDDSHNNHNNHGQNSGRSGPTSSQSPPPTTTPTSAKPTNTPNANAVQPDGESSAAMSPLSMKATLISATVASVVWFLF